MPRTERRAVIRFKQALIMSLPELPDQELTWRMHFRFGTLSCIMAGTAACIANQTRRAGSKGGMRLIVASVRGERT